MTLIGLSRQCNAFDYSSLGIRSVASSHVKENWSREKQSFSLKLSPLFCGEFQEYPAMHCFIRGTALWGGLNLQVRCTPFELMSFWIFQGLAFLTRAKFFISGCFGCLLWWRWSVSWRGPSTIELLWEQWSTAEVAERISVSLLDEWIFRCYQARRQEKGWLYIPLLLHIGWVWGFPVKAALHAASKQYG